MAGHAYTVKDWGSYRDVVLTVKISRRLLWRTRFGIAVMRLGARIATLGFRVEKEK